MASAALVTSLAIVECCPEARGFNGKGKLDKIEVEINVVSCRERVWPANSGIPKDEGLLSTTC
jgi:hypothetical protein